MDIYDEIVLDHAKKPRNFTALKNPTHTLKAANASCGDLVEFQLRVDESGTIVEVGWRGVSCAISTAAASVMSEQLVGKTIDQALSISQEDILKQLGMSEILPTREKCLRLPLKAIEELRA